MSVIIRGLPNTGYTCYLNSILQILVNTQELRLKSPPRSSNPDTRANAVCDAYENWISIHLSSSDRENATALKKFIVSFSSYYGTFGSGMQDQYEYLLLLLKIFHDSRSVRRDFSHEHTQEDYTGLQKKASDNLLKDGMWVSFNNMSNPKHKYGWDSVIFRTFTGQFHRQTICNISSCGYISHRFETFRILDIDIPETQVKKKQTLTLQDCLLWTLRDTQLDKDDSYECDKCHKKSRCLLKTSIWSCPKVLVICLKRFIVRYLPDRRVSLDKNQTDISIPLNMDLSDTKYELYGIANHTGHQSGGHCFATLKKPGGKWVTVDDTTISPANDSAFGGSTPYLLFYRMLI